MLKPFLTANWRYLAMLNFAVDPKILRRWCRRRPSSIFTTGETFLSVVGFLFLDTRVMGLPIPLHRDFEEVNLRFYVRRKSADRMAARGCFCARAGSAAGDRHRGPHILWRALFGPADAA